MLFIRSIFLLAAALSLGCSQFSAGGDPAAAGRSGDGDVRFIANHHPATNPSTQPAETMDAAEFIQYTSRPELGYISITDNLVRGPKAVGHLIKNQQSLAKSGIFPAVDRDRRHMFVRREKQAGRQINTLIIIDPPPDNADADEKDAWTEHLIVLVDGHKKIDCTIGSSLDGNLLVYAINIFPADGSIEVVAVSGDGEQLDVPDGCQDLDQPDVITDDAFEEANSEDDTPVVPPPLKVEGRATPPRSGGILRDGKGILPLRGGVAPAIEGGRS